jgi:hypothetical protein
MKRLVWLVAIIPLFLAACSTQGTPTAPAVTPPPVATTQVEARPEAVVQPTATVESKYDEAWARKQVEPALKEQYEILLAQEWNRLYDQYSDEAKVGCPRSTYVSKAAGTWVLASTFGFDEVLKALLQDLKEGKLVITFSEISKDSITFMVETGDSPEPQHLIREKGQWLGATPLEPDCASLDMEQ